MAAGLGFKDFTTGEVLTAADVDGYLMQGIWVFANATARDAAVTSPQEGNSCYLKDTDQVLTYSGSAWVAVGGGSPLTTKGDLYTYSTTDARLGVGANGTTLVADSSTATGLVWQAPAASVPANTTAYVAAPQTTTSADFTDLATAGPAVTLTTGTKALVIITSYMKNNTSNRGAQMSFVVSGATSLGADTARSVWIGNPGQPDVFLQASACYLVTLTAGSNTFTAKYQRTGGGGTAEFGDRYITVINMA
jgi:hypothetical protein